MICLHLCAACYVGFGATLLFVIWARNATQTMPGANPWVASAFGMFLIFFALLIEGLIMGLKKRNVTIRFVTQLLCLLLILSPLFPLAIPAIWGLRSAPSRLWFEKTVG